MQTVLKCIVANWVWLTALILGALSVFSLLPLPHLPEVPGSDKTHHFVAYAALVIPAVLANAKHLKWMVLVFALWSGVIELIQPFVNRYGEWLDLLANISGMSVGLIMATIVRIKYL